jgi:hypothetical protein
LQMKVQDGIQLCLLFLMMQFDAHQDIGLNL